MPVSRVSLDQMSIRFVIDGEVLWNDCCSKARLSPYFAAQSKGSTVESCHNLDLDYRHIIRMNATKKGINWGTMVALCHRAHVSKQQHKSMKAPTCQKIAFSIQSHAWRDVLQHPQTPGKEFTDAMRP